MDTPELAVDTPKFAAGTSELAVGTSVHGVGTSELVADTLELVGSPEFVTGTSKSLANPEFPNVVLTEPSIAAAELSGIVAEFTGIAADMSGIAAVFPEVVKLPSLLSELIDVRVPDFKTEVVGVKSPLKTLLIVVVCRLKMEGLVAEIEVWDLFAVGVEIVTCVEDDIIVWLEGWVMGKVVIDGIAWVVGLVWIIGIPWILGILWVVFLATAVVCVVVTAVVIDRDEVLFLNITAEVSLLAWTNPEIAFTAGFPKIELETGFCKVVEGLEVTNREVPEKPNAVGFTWVLPKEGALDEEVKFFAGGREKEKLLDVEVVLIEVTFVNVTPTEVKPVEAKFAEAVFGGALITNFADVKGAVFLTNKLGFEAEETVNGLTFEVTVVNTENEGFVTLEVILNVKGFVVEALTIPLLQTGVIVKPEAEKIGTEAVPLSVFTAVTFVDKLAALDVGANAEPKPIFPPVLAVVIVAFGTKLPLEETNLKAKLFCGIPAISADGLTNIAFWFPLVSTKADLGVDVTPRAFFTLETCVRDG